MIKVYIIDLQKLHSIFIELATIRSYNKKYTNVPMISK